MVWEKSKLVFIDLYGLTKSFLDDEKFGITSQIRRAAVSVPTNIAEGHGRNSNVYFSRFLYISLGSIRELETLVEISCDLGYIGDAREVLAKLDELAKMISSLINTLRG